jgi:DNA-directed RNA polymerase subunit RPC12/RpoP
MTLYTVCENCEKPINADLSHRGAVAMPGETRLAAIIQCENCRSKIEVLITTKTRSTEE